MTQTKYRTHTCGELRMENVGQTVTVAGWLENLREVGSNLGFLVLRDMHGVTQVVIETEEMMAQVKAINKESVLAVTGAVRERASKNPKLPTGDIEVVPSEIQVLGRCRHNELEAGKAELKNMKTGEKRKIAINGQDFINDYVTVSTEAEDFSQDGIFF